jgi:DNA-binding MarR family transcriptional regulator
MILKRRAFPPGVVVKRALDLAHFLPYRIHLLATRIANPPPTILSKGLTIRTRDWRILACLGGFGPLTNREICRVVGMDAATISRGVQYLQQKGLVITRVSRTDRRKQVISLTVKGAAAHDEIAPARRNAGVRIDNLLSDKDRKELYRILDHLDEGLERLGDEFEGAWDDPSGRE